MASRSTEEPGGRSPPRSRDGWLLGGLVLVLYCALAQGSFYKVDGQALLYLSQAGSLQHKYHTFYLPLLDLLAVPCRALGLGLFETARLYSALGTALGVVLVHAACRRMDLSRLGTNVATLLVGLSPAVVFFATVVEVHGPFFAFAGLALLAAARAVRAPSAAGAALLGLCLGLAYLAHPTGALMIFLLPALQAIAARRAPEAALSLRGLARTGTWAAVPLALVILVVPRLLRARAGAGVDAGAALDVLLHFSGQDLLAPLRTLEVALDEWLLPFLPASALALAALAPRRTRLPAALLLAGLLPYLLAAQLMLDEYSERGAYLLPAVWPTALLALEILHRWRALTVPAVLVAAALAVAQVHAHDEPERPRGFARGLRELAGGDEFLLIAGHEDDVAAHLIHFEHLPVLYLGHVIDVPAEQVPETLARIDGYLAEQHARGRDVFVSEATLADLRRAAESGLWPLSHDPPVRVAGRAAAAILAHLESRYLLEPARAAGFAGYRLRRRE